MSFKILLQDLSFRCYEQKVESLHVLLLPNFIRSAHSFQECGKNDTHQLFYSFITTLRK